MSDENRLNEEEDTKRYRCNKCGEEKLRSEFYPDTSKRNGIRSSCKVCHIKANSEPAAMKAKQLRRSIARKKDPRKEMLYSAKNRAKNSGVPFSLTVDDIYIPPVCPVLGIRLKVGEGLNGPDSPSLDRIKPELGYVPGNVAVISYRANRMKNDATVEELEALIAYIRSFDRVCLSRFTTVKVHIEKEEPKSHTPNTAG